MSSDALRGKLLELIVLKMRAIWFHSERKNKQMNEMGSLEEDELMQMVQDFIESEYASAFSSTSSNDDQALNFRTQHSILQEILGSQTAVEAMVRKFTLLNLKEGKRSDSEKSIALMRKWLALQLQMSYLNASLCQTSWPTSIGCPAGRYEYIGVLVEDDNGNPTRLIVDIDFRSQFELARPTETYKQLTDTLPVLFVGSENKLSRIISILCSASKQSFRERGFHVPPWRNVDYMQSKWRLSASNQRKPLGNAGFSPETSLAAKDDDGIHGFAGKCEPPTAVVKPKRHGWCVWVDPSVL